MKPSLTKHTGLRSTNPRPSIAYQRPGIRCGQGKFKDGSSCPDCESCCESICNRNSLLTNHLSIQGSAVSMPWVDEVAAVVWAPYGGSETGRAIGDILFGHQSPSGRLSLTFPKRDGDMPAIAGINFGSQEGVVEYTEGIFTGYRWYSARGLKPLFPFGHVSCSLHRLGDAIKLKFG